MKTVAIMQPYFLPYIGYFQLISCSDVFVVYDNIQYTKKGWINRNRYLVNGRDELFSIPLQKASDSLDVVQRNVAESFAPEKLVAKITGAYRGAPFFSEGVALFTKAAHCPSQNLFEFLYHSIQVVCQYLGIDTTLLPSSAVSIDHSLRSQERVIAICKALGATRYINPIGGLDLYSGPSFASHHIELEFLKARPFQYQQFGEDFVPWLSILDLIMFNSREALAHQLSEFDLIPPHPLEAVGA